MNSAEKKFENQGLSIALRGNRTPGGSMATTQVTTTPLMLADVPVYGPYDAANQYIITSMI
jgi:hypothetical protein